jgi:hypothetical protein
VLVNQIFHTLADVEPLASEQLKREGLISLFDRYDWFARTANECPMAGEPIIANASVGGYGAWLFLCRDEAGHAAAISSWYTLAFRPVFRGNPPPEVQARLLTAIALELRGHVASITLSPMQAGDCAITRSAFRDAGWLTLADKTDCNWTTNVSGKSFADYWAQRPGQLRKTVKSKRAKANMDITILSHFDEAAWADYEDVYAHSWKPAEGASKFLRSMAEFEGAAGALRLGIGRIDGQPVAAQFWTCENGTAIAHKVAHREDARHLSPGSILSAAMFERLIDGDRVRCIDFGTGDNDYKRSWMDSCQPLYTLRLYNKRRAAGLSAAATATSRKAIRVLTCKLR